MAVDYRDVFAPAEDLATRADSEAAQRAAVGRFYYGMLMFVRKALIPNPTQRRGHQQAILVLGRRTRRSTKRICEELYRLRLDADHEPLANNWSGNVVRARRICQQIVAELRRRHLAAQSSP